MQKLYIFSWWYWRLNIHILELYIFSLVVQGFMYTRQAFYHDTTLNICDLKWRCMAQLYIKDKWLRNVCSDLRIAFKDNLKRVFSPEDRDDHQFQ